MITREYIKNEIEEILSLDSLSSSNLNHLFMLYGLLDRMEPQGETRDGYDWALFWVDKMQNADGTTGAHWNMEATEDVRRKKGLTCNPVDFNVAMNMMYSDYYDVARTCGVDTPNFYANMAYAFLTDKDAKPNKLKLYHDHVVA